MDSLALKQLLPFLQFYGWKKIAKVTPARLSTLVGTHPCHCHFRLSQVGGDILHGGRLRPRLQITNHLRRLGVLCGCRPRRAQQASAALIKLEVST